MFVIRNCYAVAAHNRNSAGPMKDRRAQRGGTRNDMREYLEEYRDEDTWENSLVCAANQSTTKG